MVLQNLVPPYLDVLIQKLLSLLQNGQKVVQEGALTAMASVADCAKDSFAKYYTEVSRAFCNTRTEQASLLGSHTLTPVLHNTTLYTEGDLSRR